MRRAIVCGALLGALLPAGTAAATADIEAVWSFGGGQIAFQAAGDGSYTATVIRATSLSERTHAVGEEMEIDVRLQPDGQWFGRHQWFATGSCEPRSERGNTAYRVLAKPDGSRFLRICFAAPERQDLQPSIAPDGSSTNTTTSCSDSDLVGALPAEAPKVQDIATLPPTKRCLSRRSFRIRLKEPPGDALVSAKVYVNGKLVQTRVGDRITAPVSLKGLPKGRYAVKIIAKTALGRTISGTRRYRTCSKKRRGGRIRI